MARQWHAENRLYCPSVPACKLAADSTFPVESPHATQLAVLSIGWRRVRFRTFLEYGPVSPPGRSC